MNGVYQLQYNVIVILPTANKELRGTRSGDDADFGAKNISVAFCYGIWPSQQMFFVYSSIRNKARPLTPTTIYRSC